MMLLQGWIKACRVWFVCVLLLLAPAASWAAWKSITPGGGGWYEAVGIGPDGLLVVGSDLSGAYISRDDGKTWTIAGATQGVTTTHVSSVGFDPTNPQIVLLGSDSGIFRSTNKGNSFTPVLTDSSYITAIQSAPSAPATLYAAGHAAYNLANAEIYISTNRGASWTKQATSLWGKRIQKLVIHPTKPNELYAISAPDRFVSADDASRKVYRSTDAGKTWQEFAASLKRRVFDFALVSTNAREMYLSTDTGILYSSNAGASWTDTGLPPEYDYDGNNVGYSLWLPAGSSSSVRAISNALTLWGSSNGVWLGNKSGTGSTFGWTSLNQSLDAIGAKAFWETPDYWHFAERGQGDLRTGFYHNGESLRTLAFDPRNNKRMVFVNDQWAFASSDGGKSFRNLFTNQVGTGWSSRGLDNANVYTVEASRWSSGNVLLAGYADMGCWRSLNNGNSWESCQAPGKGWNGDFGGNVSALASDPKRNGVVWAAMGESLEGGMTLMRSNQSGKFDSWIASMNGIPAKDARLLFGLSVDKNSPASNRTLFVTANGNVYRSQNDGWSWQKVLDCRSRTRQQNGVEAYCTTTAVDHFNRNLVYAAGSAGVFTSWDGGTTWSWTDTNRMKTPVPLASLFSPWGGRYFVSGMATDPLIPGRVYIAVFDQQASGNRGGVWKGTQGSGWTRLYNNPYLRSIVASPYNSGELLAVSSLAYGDGGYSPQSAGVLKYNPASNTWQKLNQGLAFNNLSSIVFGAVSGRFILGSMGQGVMRNW